MAFVLVAGFGWLAGRGCGVNRQQPVKLGLDSLESPHALCGKRPIGFRESMNHDRRWSHCLKWHSAVILWTAHA
jgi:hypothetical protein